MYIEKSLAKFKINQTYEYFPGNTIIHFIRDEKQIGVIKAIHDEMIANPLFKKFVFLPVDSYHMTVCDLLTYADLYSNEKYSNFKHKGLKRIVDIDSQVLADLGRELFELNVTMVPESIRSKKIRLKPKTKEDEQKLADFRNSVSEKIGFELDPEYKFHISLAYQLEILTDGEQAEMDKVLAALNKKYLHLIGDVNIDSAVFTLFNDMSQYGRYKNGRANLGIAEISYTEI